LQKRQSKASVQTVEIKAEANHNGFAGFMPRKS